MKKLFLLSLIFTIINTNAQSSLLNKEFRATWVITWEYISSGSSVEQNKARIREIMDNHEKANMTSVLFQVRQGGTAYYNSSYEPWGSYAGASYPGFDPLQYAIEEAHKRGLELHAWFNVFNVSSTLPGTISDEHPEWICRDQNGNPMTSYRAASPGLPAVRDYTVNVAMEIVRNYDIDGLHLDYIRWNEYDTDDMINPPSPLEQVSKLDGDFSEDRISKIADPNSTNRFLYDVEHPYSNGVPSGFSSWEDWWRWSVTEFVRTLHDSVQTVKPWVRLSPAALGKYKEGGSGGWNGYYVVYQDAALWFNEGYIDQLTPMHYHWLDGTSMLNAISNDWEPNIQQGINEGRLYTAGPGSYLLAQNNVWSNHFGIVNTLRQKNWIDGFQFFSYGSWRGYNYWEEATGSFFLDKVKVRSINPSVQPLKPSLVLTKIDSLNYTITITPDASVAENEWYAIYRSEDNNLDVSSDKIINIHFGNTAYSLNQSFDGLQNYNGTYTYFATTLNRYWAESEISNFASTDPIPSFVPQVVSTIPGQNDTINVNKSIVINFSKSMKVTSFYSYLSFDPMVQITSLSWSNEHKTLTIETENFNFSTDYTLMISENAVDFNDVMLDGNGDGISGDPFTLHFSTNDSDSFPPQIINTFPSDNQDSIDIGSIIFVEFDEKIDEQTLVNNGISLSSNEGEVEFSYLLSETDDGRSVLSIQPNELLEISSTYTLALSPNIADTLGNILGEEKNYSFTTSSASYFEIRMIDDFTNPGDWWNPSGSGSTTGIFESGTTFGFTSKIAIPLSDPKRAAKLSYLWDEAAGTHLIREYLSGGTPQSTYFDTSYVLQSFVYGDGSNNMMRFCIDENDGSAWGDHEVSNWIAIDWNGWKLVEWQLNDPNSVGTWISPNETLTGSYYRIDSYQLTKSEEGSTSGAIYFDDLRAVKKIIIPTGVEAVEGNIPTKFKLEQNYPNPFNPTTTINFSIPKMSFVTLTVYDVLGKEIIKLVNEEKSAGNYQVEFNALGLTSGTYFYRLQSDEFLQTKKMIILK